MKTFEIISDEVAEKRISDNYGQCSTYYKSGVQRALAGYSIYEFQGLLCSQMQQDEVTCYYYGYRVGPIKYKEQQLNKMLEGSDEQL